MDKSRRNFIRLASLSALGMGAAPALARAETASAVYTETTEAADMYGPNANALEGTHWGMVIDTTKLTTPEDIAPIVEACHSIHNVPDIGNDQEIKWIWSATFHESFTEKHNHYLAEEIHERPFLLLCNHCEHPPCCRVCPTQATFKRESDGVVLMDFHRCIGCRFCMAACPYGARSFNFGDPRPYISQINHEFPTRTRGVVEKCNFCAERLAKGEEPACVEASNGAIIFGDLDDPHSEVREVLKEHFTIRRKPTLGTQPSVYYII
ncbi:MAG: 4Fe-4S dicluster domain-containing protein [Desulfovibrio sp.]|nr:MAG: 4Fe-4S dicluster domain-containing protein [Desulfovibrio sp.]